MMNEPKGHEPGEGDDSIHSTTEFSRPFWAPKKPNFSDSTPRVTTDELRRPVFTPSDSVPRVATADIPRPPFQR
jgi:hypothetical protein